MSPVDILGASFLDPLDDDCGGVAVCPLKASSRRFLGFRGVTFCFIVSSIRLCLVVEDDGSLDISP